MSDRRLLIVLTALIVGGLGVLLGAGSLLELGSPVAQAGDDGGPVDLTRPLIALVVIGGATAVSGVVVATAILRAQLRR